MSGLSAILAPDQQSESAFPGLALKKLGVVE
ncbi:MAG: hypothetical protein RIR35_883, partial [Actinomycetota bacterium]